MKEKIKMKKRILIGMLLLVAAVSMNAQKKEFPRLTGPFLGQKPPGMTPTLFAPHILPLSSFHTSPTFMPDGRETYWKMQGTTTISMMKTADDLWMPPAEISLSSVLKDFRDPMISPDGKKMFFLSKGKLPERLENTINSENMCETTP